MFQIIITKTDFLFLCFNLFSKLDQATTARQGVFYQFMKQLLYKVANQGFNLIFFCLSNF